VVIAEPRQAGVGEQSVGVHDCSGRGRGLGERLEGRGLRVGQHLETQAPRATAADFDRGADEHLLAVRSPALEAFFVAAEEEPVDLDFVLASHAT